MIGTILIASLASILIVTLIISSNYKRKASKEETRSYDQIRYDKVAGILRWVSVPVVIVLVLTLATNTLYLQDPGQAKVLRSFTGEVVGTDATEGLGTKPPWVDIVDYNIRNQTVEYIGDGSSNKANSNELVEGPAITAQDKDGATARIDIVVRYSIDPSSVENIYRQYGSQENFESKLIQNDVRSIVRNIPLQYSTTEFRLNREEAAIKMQESLSNRWDTSGIIVDSVDLRDIRYPESIEQSLQEVQEAINNANKAKANLETAKVDAERTRVEAQAQADYDQIVRCGAESTTVTEIINGQETQVIKVIPLQGNDCQNRLNDQVLMNKYIDALRELGKDGNVIVVPEGFGGILNTMPKSDG